MLQIVGRCDRRIFGLSPGDRISRQFANSDTPLLLVVHASTILGDTTIDWLLDNPGRLLLSDRGQPLAIAVAPKDGERAAAALAGGPSDFQSCSASAIGPQFMRKTRRKDVLFAHSVAEEGLRSVERSLFGHVYKGVTDLVTKWVWPEPAFWATKAAARLGLSPNAVTGVSILLTFVTAILFYRGEIALGLVTGWLMTFLDTVDGKLARVTVTSSPAGNLLDHVNDYVHPPVWWACLASALSRIEPELATAVWTSCGLILGTYVLGRLIEELFKRSTGFNFYLWRPFDSWFRLIVSRRNIIMLIMTAGVIVGEPIEAFVACALWSVASMVIQVVRFGQALRGLRNGRVQCWLM
jgi:phosphatidylglycerophosphate synthase